jgi:hypothetical protein
MNKSGKVIVNEEYTVSWEFNEKGIQVTLIKNEVTIGWLYDEIIEDNVV